MKKLLIEILSEEIPASFQVSAFEQFKTLVEERLSSRGFEYKNSEVDGTPRRMYFLADVSEKSASITVEKKGPLVSAPEPAIAGFLSSVGLSKKECITKNIGGKEYLFANITTPSEDLTNVLDDLVNDALHNFKWSKSMHWGSSSFYWARPIRNVMCVYGSDPVVFEIRDLNMKTNNTTSGHRVLGNSNICIQSADMYKQLMRDNYVVLRRSDRCNFILQEFDRIDAQYGIKIDRNKNLLEEVVGIVEYPTLFVGEISHEFMSIPEEVLTATMRINQRYFTTHDMSGAMSRYFVFVANIPTEDNGFTVKKGNQKVLTARLSDAKFFFEQDLKRPLGDYKDDLKKLTFHEKLGSMFDRVERIVKIANDLKHLSDKPDLFIKSAELCKCDLKTSMVGEFPEVQGIIGGHYARLQKEDEYVYKAIAEQYLPLGDNMPKTNGGILLSIADKIDLLVSFFSIEKGPTGSKDPFALRRAAIGILKLVISNRINLPRDIFSRAYDNLKESIATKLDDDTPSKVILFLKERLAVICNEYGIPKNVYNLFSSSNDILEIMDKSTQFMNLKNTEPVLEIFKRAHSIYDGSYSKISPQLFEVNEEANLYNTLNAIIIGHDLEDNFNRLNKLISPVTEFFDNVLVNADDTRVKANRMSLIKMVLDKFLKIGDFVKLL